MMNILDTQYLVEFRCDAGRQIRVYIQAEDYSDRGIVVPFVSFSEMIVYGNPHLLNPCKSYS